MKGEQHYINEGINQNKCIAQDTHTHATSSFNHLLPSKCNEILKKTD